MPFLGNQPAEGYRSIDKQTITGTGATVYTLTHKVASANDVEVFVNNVRQEPGVAYTCSGNQITFTTAVESSDDCYVVFQGRAVTSNIIESQNIADGAITNAKLSQGYVSYDSTTGAATLPAGTTAQRPASPVNGMVRYNTTEDYLEEYRSGQWLVLSNVFSASGGTITESGGYRIHTFTSSGTFSVESGSSEVEYVVVAGGGAGGYEAGGGAGGYRSSVVGESSGGGSSAESKLSVSSGSYTVTVGAGGSGIESANQSPPISGSNSTFASITAVGGGGGGFYSAGTRDGGSGGSGGGAASSTSSGGGSGTSGQGYAGGYNSGGGGGASAAGGNGFAVGAAVGGAGVSSSITGSAVTRAGGGGGSPQSAGSTPGGSGGGGTGVSPGPGGNGTANTGGGGGGYWSFGNGPSGSGGSGIVIIRYAI
jgi:membrane-bound inhibitor of C-type lysozyme